MESYAYTSPMACMHKYMQNLSILGLNYLGL